MTSHFFIGMLKAQLLMLVLSLCCLQASFADGPVTDKAISDSSNTSEWLSYGRNHNEQRYSPLKKIDSKNINQLAVEWYLDLPNDVGLVSTPLVKDGVIYFIGTMNVVRSVDARTGQLLWSYDPKVAEEIGGRKQVGWAHNRGISMFGNNLFFATWDGRLIALDIKTGKRKWSTRTFHIDEPLYITGAPKAFRGKVLIGNGGTENGPSRGYVSAYDAETGALAWRFFIVPGDPKEGFENAAMEMAAKTWTGEWWKHGGGGNSWHGFTYDPEFNTVYVGTGNGSPWNQKIRSPEGGDNLFLCSILALDADTGEYKWHYQTTPGETWDFNSNMDIVLADLKIEGEVVKAIMHAPKNGFFYVIDRTDGRLISAEAFADVSWASHVDMKTGRPVEIEGARYEDGQQVITPSPFGAHSWHAMSYSPRTGLVYLPTLHWAVDYDDAAYGEEWRGKPFALGTAVDFVEGESPRPYEGSLQAWDPITQKQVWSNPQETGWGAGTLVTGSDLLFQGLPTGKLVAYDAKNGEALWSYDAGLGISAPPITYELDGKQYLSILVGFGGGYASGFAFGASATKLGWAYGAQTRRLLTFTLGGSAKVPPQGRPVFAQPIFESDFEVDSDLATAGETLYAENFCVTCHGANAIASGMAPDLRSSAIPLSEMAPVFAQIVREGIKTGRGMPGIPELSDAELEALRHFIRMKAHEGFE